MPTVSAGQTLAPPAATASASAPVPAIAVNVPAPAATAAASAPVPGIAAKVPPPAATAAASAPTPAIAVKLAIPAATAAASAPVPTVTAVSTVAPPAATAAASAPVPTLVLGLAIPAATAAASAPVPSVTVSTPSNISASGVSVSSGSALGVSVLIANRPILQDTTEDELLIRQKVLTLSPAGTDGTATANGLLLLSRPGILTYLQVSYTNQASTTDLTIQADSSSGATLFTATNCNTNIGPALLSPAGLSATNGSVTAAPGGVPFSTGLYVAVAQANVSTADAKDIVVTMWITF